MKRRGTQGDAQQPNVMQLDLSDECIKPFGMADGAPVALCSPVCPVVPSSNRRRLGLTLSVKVQATTAAAAQINKAATSADCMADAHAALEARGYRVARFLKASLFGCVMLCSIESSGGDASPPSPIPSAQPQMVVCKISRLEFARQQKSPDEDGRLSQVRDRVLAEGGILRAAASDSTSDSSESGVARLVDEFTDGAFHYLITAYAGVELFDVVSARALPLEQTRRYASQLLDAVAHLHERGVAHLDLGLSNVCVDEATSVIRIIDFGLADGGDSPETLEEPDTSRLLSASSTATPALAPFTPLFTPLRSSSTSPPSTFSSLTHRAPLAPYPPHFSLAFGSMTSPALSAFSSRAHSPALSLPPSTPVLSAGVCSPTLPALAASLAKHCQMDLTPTIATTDEDLPPLPVPVAFSPSGSVRRQLFKSSGASPMTQTPSPALFSPQPPLHTLSASLFPPSSVLSASSSVSTSDRSRSGSFSWPGFGPGTNGTNTGASSQAASPSHRRRSLSPAPAYPRYWQRLRSDLPPSKVHSQSPEQRACTSHHTSAVAPLGPPPAWCPFGADVFALGVMLFEMATGAKWSREYEQPLGGTRPDHVDPQVWSVVQACTQPMHQRAGLKDLQAHPFFTDQAE